VNSVIAESALENIEAGKFQQLSEDLISIEKVQPAVTMSSIIVEEDDALKVVAKSESADDELDAGTELQVKIAFDRKLPIAKLINVTEGNGNTAQAWNVVTPAINADGKVVAVVASSLLTTDAQEAIASSYQKSFIVLVLSIIVILALLFRHFRLMGYAQLLAKQREVNQTMSDFLSVATHELKAPMTIIKGYLSNVMDGMFGPIDEKVRQQLEVAFAQTDRLNVLVQDLLNVSRIDQGRISYSITSVDSTKTLRMLSDQFKAIAAEKNLELILNLPENVPLVKADEGRMQEVFTNLIDNAIKYTAKGTVTVSQQVNKNFAVTSIKDTGYGMSEESRKRLFQRFYRVKTKDTQNIAGTGLGLWIIKQYITAMGGSIEVESMEGVGSNFIVKLPIA
jgi:signal transduction histidine kinase